jgi:cystathionine beta-lyase
MLPPDFDIPVQREGTASLKFDGRQQVFGRADINPLWVADMDFASPDCIQAAIAERNQHPVYGYSLLPEDFYQSVIDWFATRHHWQIEREWIVAAPGVVSSLHAACLAFAGEGEGVIIQPPVYHPFLGAIQKTRRRALLNPLQLTADGYRMNFQQLETLAVDARLLMLCSPHNPVGRVWRREELLQLLEIARRHDLYIISDDIHADLVFSESKHTILASLGEGFEEYLAERIITAVSPNKSFNIPGLGLSCLIIPNADSRKKIQSAYDLIAANYANPLSLVAFMAAYQQGAPWLDALLKYLQGNRDFVLNSIRQQLPMLKAGQSEGTCLMWLDCSALQLDDAALHAFMINNCGVGLSPGRQFGEQGSGFMRLNIGTSRARLADALSAIKTGIQAR